ncbi:MAG TPA: hypothetical protein VF982_00985 [Anaerolineales bacterium]
MIWRTVALGAIGLALAGCGEQGTYTLYRDSPLDPVMRIHVASFDTGEGADYNQENCRLAADLFGRQLGVISRFWCEKGGFEQ